ncbi:MAG TPA: IPT/TIG domain-containing protein [Candidatus Paceibacterota bacterium]|nr:IPT/TIG domain-containing protein [Candidatus Paceibacterota bacterium]
MKSGKLIFIPAAGIALVVALSAWAAIASASTAPTTEPATAITSSNATLNAMNSGTAATDSSFWVSTSTFSTASPTLPSNVYSTADLGAQGAGASFSAALSSATGMPAVTPGTTYFFTVWTSTDGGTTWTPGAVLSFSTLSSAPTITNVAPDSGSTAGGTTVTVTGTNLSGATAVDFGGVPATDVTGSSTASETSLTAISPATTTAGTVDVTVTTPSGTSGTSSADRFTYTAPAATLVISDISANATGTSTATISWTTDVPSSSQVEYGTSATYSASSTLGTTPVTSHSVSLTDLSEATLYHFAVMSGDNVGTSTSADNEFVTQSTASTTPLAIDSITTNQSSGIADNTFTDGWQWTIHFTVPDNENAFRIRFSDWGNASNSFATANDVQVYSPESSNASSSGSALLETGNGYSDWLYLTGDTATTTAGRQIDLVVQVKIPFGTANGSYSSNFTAQTFPSTATSTAQ